MFKNKLRNTWVAAILKTSEVSGYKIIGLVGRPRIKTKIKTYEQEVIWLWASSIHCKSKMEKQGSQAQESR